MKKILKKGLAFMLSLTMLLGMVTTAHAESAGTDDDKLEAGTYTVSVDMRKETDGTSTSMAAGVLNKTAELEVAADGTMKLSLNFPKDVQIMNTSVHVTGIDIYEKDGATLMAAALTTYDAKLRDTAGNYTVDGKAVSDAVITLSYQAEDGLYPGKIYSDFMSAGMQIYVDFANAEKQAEPVDRTALDEAITEAESKVEAEYTKESWTNFQTALTEAKAVADDADQTTVDTAKDALLAAIAALEAAPTETLPVVPEDAVASITAADGAVTYYTSLADTAEVTDEDGNVTAPAAAGAVSSLKGGEILTLLKDADYAGVKSKSGEIEMSFSFEGEAVLNLNGHTLTGTLNSNMIYLMEVENGSLTVQNGTIALAIPEGSGNSKGSVLYVKEGAEAAIAGDVKISGGRYGILSDGTLTVNPGAVIEATSNYALVTDSAAASVIVDGAVLTGKSFGMYIFAGNVSVKNSAITSTVYAGGDSVVTLENCTVTDESSYAVCAATGGTVIITGGDYVSGGAYAVMVNSASANAKAGSATINGGNFKAAYRAVKGAAEYPEGMIMNNVVNEEGYFVLIPESEYTPIYVAQIGDVKYEELSDAFDALKDGDTIVLLSDVILTSSVTIGTAAKEESVDADGNVTPAVPFSENTLDLNGFTLNASNYITNNGTFKIVDSSEEKTGVYSSSATYGFYPNAGLILDGITVKYNGSTMFVVGRCKDEETGIQILNCRVETAKGVSGLQSSNKGPVIIKDSVIESETSGVSVGSYADTLIIENTTIHAKNSVGVATAVPTTLTNCNITVDESVNGGGYAVRNNGSKSESVVTINGGVYKGVVTSLKADNLYGEFIINDGEFYASASAADEEGNVTVTDSSYAVVSAGKTTINGGYFKGTENVVDGFTVLPDGKKLAVVETEGNAHQGWYALADRTAQDDAVAPEYEAELTLPDGSKVGLEKLNNLYFYLEEGECSVTLLKDIVASRTIVLKSGTDLTFDLNGRTLAADTELSYLFDLSSSDASLRLIDSSDAGTGLVQIGNSGYIINSVVSDAEIAGGAYKAGSIAGLTVGGTVSVTGGAFEVDSALLYSFGGGVSISGGKFKTDAVKNYLAAGAALSAPDENGWYTVEMGDVDAVAYPVAYHLYGSGMGMDYAAMTNSEAYVTVDMDGRAWVNLEMPSALSMISVASITAPDGSDVSADSYTVTMTEAEEGSDSYISILSFPLEDVYGKADDANYTTGKNCYIFKINCLIADMSADVTTYTYYTTFDWADYEGPVGASKAYEVSVNHSGTAMSDYSFNTTEVIYVFENGYSFMKVDMDNFFLGMGYERGGSMNSGEMTALSSQSGSYPAYVLTEYETITSAKFGEFQSLAKALVSLENDQTEMAMSTEMKIDAMGFSVVLADTLKWENPDTSATLEDLIEKAESLTEEDYTEESWTALQEALTAAKVIAAKEDAAEEEIENAKDALYSAIVNLAEAEEVDWTELEAAIAEAEALSEFDYTAESWEALKTALDNAKGLGEDATQAQVDMYLSALNKALGALASAQPVPTGDLKPGTYTVAVDLRKETDGNASSMSNAFMNKTASLTVAEDGTLTLSLSFPENAQYAGITAHVLDIVVYGEDGAAEMARTNKTYTTTLTDETEGKAINGSDITLTYQSDTGLYKASLVSDFMGTSGVQLYVDFSTVARKDGEEPAPEKADKTTLESVIAKAEALTESDYTDDSWKAVAEALTAAKAVNADDAATQAAVDAAMNTLSTAVSALVKADDEQQGGEEKDYTPGTYNAPITMYVDAMNQSFLIDGHVVVAEDGTAAMLIDFTKISTDGGVTWVSAYDTETVYYLAFNGYSLDGTSANLTKDGAQITWIDVTDSKGNKYHCLNTVEFPLPYMTTDSEGIAEYLVSLKFFVPAMANLEFAANGFDYSVKLTVDLSDIPVKKTDDNSGNSNNNTDDSNGGKLTITGAATINNLGTNGTGATSVNTGDELNTLPWTLALAMSAIAIICLALSSRGFRKKEQE